MFELDSGRKTLFITGGIAAILQLVTILTYSVLVGVLGPKSTSALEYFDIYQSSPLEAFCEAISCCWS